MNQHLSTTEKLSIEPCKFIMLQSKLQGWLIADKPMTRALIREQLEAGGPDWRQVGRELLIN